MVNVARAGGWESHGKGARFAALHTATRQGIARREAKTRRGACMVRAYALRSMADKSVRTLQTSAPQRIEVRIGKPVI